MTTNELKRLTNIQLDNLKASFDLCDKDGSGEISIQEYMRLMKSLN
jgi:Ca2+-binding EF-hand superfamily protein